MANHLELIENKQSTAIVPAFSFSDMQAMATAFAQGGMFGSNNPHAVLSLMLVAQAEGKHPAQIMQDYHVVSGKPAKKADAMLRDFLSSGGKVEWHQLTDDVADATFSHPVGGSVRITWDDKRVAQAQLGGNQMHKKYPRQMKRSRCVSEGVRTVFPGATGGFYVPEEIVDFDHKPQRPEPKRATNVTHDVSEDKRFKAEEWVEAHLRDIGSTDDPKGLADRTAKAVAKLEKDHPDLFEEVVEAWAARNEQEGGAGQEEADEAPPSDWVARIDECTTLKQLDKLEAEFDKVSASLSDKAEASTRQQFDLMRKALKGE